MARSKTPGEPVVALLVVLGTRIVGVRAIEMRGTAGLKARRPANVRVLLKDVSLCLTDSYFYNVFYFVLLITM